MNRWDQRAFLRGSAASVCAWGLAVLIGAATDEGHVAWMERLGRALPVAPLAVAAGVALFASVARRQGELLALSCLGQSEARSLRFASIGAWVPVALLGFAAAVGALPVSSFYPRPFGAPPHVVATASGFLDEERGIRVGLDGAFMGFFQRHEAPPMAASITMRVVAGASVMLAGAVFAWAFEARAGPARRFAMALAFTAGVAAIICFQIVAAERCGPWLALAPPLVALPVLWVRRHR